MSEYKKIIDTIRKFNRFYTVNMGFLNSNYLFEIKMNESCTQSDIVKILHIDKSYLSRIVQRLCTRGIMQKIKSEDDKRTTKITLTEMGKKETDRLIELTNMQIGAKVAGLSKEDCNELCDALNTIILILGKEVN